MEAMRFDVVTIFPSLLKSYLEDSILKRAIDRRRVSIHFHDPRRFAVDRHKTVDDRPYGGGPGMLLMAEPYVAAIESISKKRRSKVVLLSPGAKPFTQALARTFSRLDQLILVCGRYEGFDERIKAFVDFELSIGPYVLSGGELPAMVVVEAVARLLPGVVGDPCSVVEESYTVTPDFVEYPQYTRPPTFRGRKVPKVLLSGDHAKIAAWRRTHGRRTRRKV